MSGWYALVVDARKSFVVVDIDDNDEQDAFWHMKPSLGIWKRKFHQKTIYTKFLFHIKISNNDYHNNYWTPNWLERQRQIKDIFSFEPQNPKYDHSIIFHVIIDSERKTLEI